MNFWTDFVNKMFWFVTPLVVSIPVGIIIVLIWGFLAAQAFTLSVWGITMLYAMFCVTMDMLGKPGLRWMSSDPIVERVTRHIGGKYGY